MIVINGNEYPTNVSELTLEQWANVSDVIRVFEKDGLMQMEAVLKAIGVPDKEIDELPVDFSNELSKAFANQNEEISLTEEIKGYKFTLPEVFTVGMGKVIDKLPEFGNSTIALLSFFYRDERLTSKEHHDKSHIKHKMKQLKDEKAINFVFAVGSIMEYLTNSAQGLKKDLENEVIGTDSVK